MAKPNAIQSVVNQVAIQAAKAVVMVLREAAAGPRSGANTASQRKCTEKDIADQL